MYIKDVESGKKFEAKIRVAEVKDLPLKKDGWSFNWKTASKIPNSIIYVLTITDEKHTIQGALQLINEDEMMAMELLEVHPQNLGTANKKYDRVAGCLIAFSCSESFRNEGSYHGFLTFKSKTALIDIYKSKYGASQTIGSRMYIDPEQGIRLIKQYLEN